jgi:hypothetical protein
MRVTTIRFGEDLWRLLEEQAALSGVSTSQYIREAALARAAAAAAVRGEDPLALLAGPPESPATASPDSRSEHETAAALRRKAAEIRQETKATAAEAKQAIRRTSDLREQSTRLRNSRPPANR